MTWGNQKWKGAAPSFSKRDERISKKEKLVKRRKKELAIIRVADPRAWIKKYFKAASDKNELIFIEIIGMKASRFNSSPNQAPNQDEDEIEIKTPKSKIGKNILEDKEKKATKKRNKISFTGYEPISLKLAYLFINYLVV